MGEACPVIAPLAGRRILARLGPYLGPAGATPAASGRLGSLAAATGRRLPLPASTRDAIAARAAGWMAPEDLAGRKFAGALAGVVAALLLTPLPRAPAAGALFAVAGWRLPDLRLDRRARERDERVRAALPDALDLLAACALAGMSLDRALRAIAGEVGGPLGEAIRETIRALDAGTPRRRAYRILGERAPVSDVRSLVRALERAERYGTSVARSLVVQARECRSRRRTAAEEAAHAAPVRMLFPLVLCFLPAFVLLTVAPVVLTALRSLRGP